MDRQDRSRFPLGGLSRLAQEALARISREAASVPLHELLAAVEAHLVMTRRARAANAMVNARMAEAIVERFRLLAGEWDQLPPASQPWIRGAMSYFTLTPDSEPDFTSPIGFEDDLEILNACLRLAGRDDLCLDPEDYDDV